MSCYSCGADATVAVEINAPTGWRTTTACDEHTAGKYIHEVYDDAELTECEYDRCYNDVHRSREYCPNHKYEHQRR